MSSEQSSGGEVGQSDSDVSFPSQSKDWLYTETEVRPLVTFRVFDPFLGSENTTGNTGRFEISPNEMKKKKVFLLAKMHKMITALD